MEPISAFWLFKDQTK